MGIKQQKDLIKLIAVDKVYETDAGDFTALKGINLSIGVGEFVGVIGKSGSGKSTLINMISGIDRPSSGQIFFEDKTIHALDEGKMAEWRGRSLGIVFQFFQLLSNLTVLENIMLPMDFCNIYAPNKRPQKALELLDWVGLKRHAYKMPTMLSGGQQQRVAIARALANDPPVILADEPTGNLDSKTAEHVFEMFEKLIARGKTILMVTHDMDQAKRLNRTLIISDGKIIEEYLTKTFPSLTEKQLIWTTSKLKTETYAPGSTIIKKGTSIEKLYIVTKGHVEIILTTKSGQQLVVARFGRGQYFGEIELMKGGKSIATARASFDSQVKVATLDRKTFSQLLKESEPTKKEIGQTVRQRLKQHLNHTK